MAVFGANDGNMITCDFGDVTVKVLSPTRSQGLAREKTLGTRLSSPPTVHNYYSLLVLHIAMIMSFHRSFAVSDQDKFFVSYQEEHCIKVFNKGVFLHDIGSKGSGDGQLSYPEDIVIVCDNGNNRLQVFALDG